MRPSPRQVGIPGINLAALNAVQDENARLVLQSIVETLNVRNGVAGTGGAAFITRDEISEVRREFTGMLQGLSKATRSASPVDPSQISRIINDLQGQIMTSPLWLDLGTRLEGIDLDAAQEVQARIAAVQQVADDLIAEALARLNQDNVIGGDIATLQEVSADHALSITNMLTRVDGAESSILTLNTTTANQATAIIALETRTDETEVSITNLQMTTSTQATSLTSLITRVDGAESTISELQTTTAEQATSLSTLGVQIGNAESAIVAEQTARLNADNSITTSMTTQFSAIGSTVSGIQSTLTSTATQTTANANAITSLSSSVGGLSATISTNHATMTTITGQINARYTTKVDINGYVSGYGIIATANNSTPESEFIVRADRFAIGSPSGPGITPRTPFVVLTSTDAAGNPPGVYMDMAVMKIAAITKAYIALAEVDTLRLAGNAVTIPAAVTPAGTVTISAFNTWYEIGSLSVNYGSDPDLVPGDIVLLGTSNFNFTSGTGETIYELEVLHNGASCGSVLQSSPSGYAFSAAVAAPAYGTTGTNTFTLRARRILGGTIHYAAGRGLISWGVRR